MKELNFPLLEPDDIDLKIKQCTAKGIIMLAYKNARTDMRILDETVGPFNWKREHREVKGVLYCTISIFDERHGVWISKEDCGIKSRDDGEGNATKGEASDAFKRAGSCWGIGRELYSAPFLFLKVPTKEDGVTKSGKKRYVPEYPNETYRVSEIGYDDKRRINRLVIVDKFNNPVYQYGESKDGLKQYCEICGSEIIPFTNQDGKFVTVEQSIKGTIEVFGQILCYKCYQAMVNERNVKKKMAKEEKYAGKS